MKRFFLLGCAVLAAAAAVRYPFLSVRPMHTDEAVHAVKLGRLIETGFYQYEPLEYHGPTLYYLAGLGARLAGVHSLEELTEGMVRGITALFGTLAVLLPLLMGEALGRRAVFFSSVLLAFSPAFVFYSDYFIHEIVLVFFLGCFLGGLCKYLKEPKTRWAVFTGLSAGLMFATKETSVLSFAAAALAFLLLWRPSAGKPFSFRPVHIVGGLASFLVVWLLLFSGFGTHWQGLADSIRSLWLYPTHAARQSAHFHPWWYYLDLLTWVEFFEPLSWNEDGIAALAFFGFFIVLHERPDSKSFPSSAFLGLFTLILTIFYSIIPYKTPWNVLSFLYGMSLLAGTAADRFLRWSAGPKEQWIAAAVLLIFGLFSPLIQSLFLMTKYAASPSNPYVYGHTTPDIFQMTEKVRQAAEACGEGEHLYIQIFAEGGDYWPWPWYLRNFKTVGYWNRPDPDCPAAPLILAEARLEPAILEYLYELPPPGYRHLYLPFFDKPVYLRPSLEWRGYIRKDFSDRIRLVGPKTSSRVE